MMGHLEAGQAQLFQLGEPFVDTPASVIERLLDQQEYQISTTQDREVGALKTGGITARCSNIDNYCAEFVEPAPAASR